MKNIYDEKIYLKGDKEALDRFESDCNVYKYIKENEKIKYESLLNKYYLLLDEIVNLLKLLELNNSIEYSLALSYLIENNYLSYKEFDYNKEKHNEITTVPGLTIINGSGCCRHFTDIQKSIFDKLDIFCKKFYCYESEIKYNNKLRANHIVNLISYNNLMYGIDLYNYNSLYKFTGKYYMKAINDVSVYLTYKPYFEMIIEESNLDLINDYIKYFKKIANDDYISYLEYNDNIKYNINNYLKNNSNKMIEFSNDTLELKKDISNELDNISLTK